MLLFGIMEVGYLLNQQISLSAAAREGARAYALHHDEASFNLESVVRGAAPSVDGLQVFVSLPSGTCPSDQTVTVEAVDTYQPFTGIFFFLSGKQLTGKGVIRCGG